MTNPIEKLRNNGFVIRRDSDSESGGTLKCEKLFKIPDRISCGGITQNIKVNFKIFQKEINAFLLHETRDNKKPRVAS